MRNENCVFCKIINGDIPSTKLYEDEKKEKEEIIAELYRIKKLQEQTIIENKNLKERIQMQDSEGDRYRKKISELETKIKTLEQENEKIKSSFWYKLFWRK